MADGPQGLKVRQLRVLRGPNLHARRPVLEAELDLGAFEGKSTLDFPGMVDRLTTWLPGLIAHPCTKPGAGGFIERLEEGTDLAHVCEHVVLALQSFAGFDVRFGRARHVVDSAHRVLVGFEAEAPARACLELGLRLTAAAALDEAVDLPQELEKLLAVAEVHRLDPGTAALCAEARRRQIPVFRVEEPGNLVQLGEGALQKRVRGSETSQTSSQGMALCQQRALSRKLLEQVGVPLPEARQAGSEEEALQAAHALGYPVALKPATGPAGKAVFGQLSTDDELREAFREAAPLGPVLVERHVEGQDFRLLVVGNRLLAAARRDPPTVLGDGQETVRQLVGRANGDPRRRPGAPDGLARIALDACAQAALTEQDLDFDSVPERGQQVRLGPCGKLSVGGTATDVTEKVHPSTAKVAELVARTLGLELAGIDVVCPDISQPLDGQRGAVVGIHAAPGLRMHLQPTAGTARDVAGPIVELLFPRGARGNIPLVAAAGPHAPEVLARTARLFAQLGRVPGMATGGRVRVDADPVTGTPSEWESARRLLLHPLAQAGAVEVTERGLRDEGLGFERCNAVVLESAEALSPEGLTALLGTLGPRGVAVAPASEAALVEALQRAGARVLLWSPVPGPELAAHRQAGGAVVWIQDGALVLARGERAEVVGPAGAEPAAPLLPAVAGAWAAGVPVRELRRAFSARGVAAPVEPQGVGST